MNGNGYEAYDYELDDLEDVGDYESDDELAFLEEDDEARRRPRRRTVRTGKGAGYFRQPTSRSYVTQTQFKAALAKIGNDVKANAAGVKTVNGRVSAISASQSRQSAMLKKEIAERKKEIAKLKSGVQMASILPLITSKTVTVPAGSTIFGTETTAETKLQVAPSAISALLPMMLTGDGMGGGDNSSMLFLALALGGGL
jgi:hypothetical protein